MDKIVDVIIPAYKPREEFKELIKRLSRQQYSIHEIHVIHTEGGAFPTSFCEEHGVIVTHIPREAFDHGGTRHQGMIGSKADIVVFMTQDAIPADMQLIGNLVKAFEQEKVGAAYARQLPAKDCDWIERYTRTFNYPENSQVKGEGDIGKLGVKTFFCSNVCAAYRRDVYEQLGGFERRTIFNEDMIFAGHMVKAGYKIAYQAEAQVIHSHNYSGVQQFHRNFDMAVSQAEHPEVFAGIKSESEGIRLVLQTMRYLAATKKIHLIPVLVYKSTCKYLGYKLGYRFDKLPKWLILQCTMNREYWKN